MLFNPELLELNDIIQQGECVVVDEKSDRDEVEFIEVSCFEEVFGLYIVEQVDLKYVLAKLKL